MPDLEKELPINQSTCGIPLNICQRFQAQLSASYSEIFQKLKRKSGVAVIFQQNYRSKVCNFAEKGFHRSCFSKIFFKIFSKTNL